MRSLGLFGVVTMVFFLCIWSLIGWVAYLNRPLFIDDSYVAAAVNSTNVKSHPGLLTAYPGDTLWIQRGLCVDRPANVTMTRVFDGPYLIQKPIVSRTLLPGPDCNDKIFPSVIPIDTPPGFYVYETTYSWRGFLWPFWKQVPALTIQILKKPGLVQHLQQVVPILPPCKSYFFGIFKSCPPYPKLTVND